MKAGDCREINFMLNDQVENLTERLSNARDSGDLPFRTEFFTSEYKY